MNNKSKAKERELVVSGIEIKISRKRIKNAYIYVKPPEGEVLVSAPSSMSFADIVGFIDSKKEWIIKNREKIRHKPHNEKKASETGDVIYVWGKPYILNIVEGAERDGFEISEIFVELKVKGSSDEQKRGRLIKKFYAKLLKEKLDLRLPEWEEKTGLKSSSWTVRYMTSRWGSCNIRTKKLNFNTQLAEKDPRLLEYVILHELAHTKVANHGKEFKAILDRYMPDWKERRREL